MHAYIHAFTNKCSLYIDFLNTVGHRYSHDTFTSLLPYSLFSLSFKSRAVNAQSKYSDLRLSIDFRKVVDCGA